MSSIKYRAARGAVEGIETLVLHSGAGGGIEAHFAPAAGMVGCSLRLAGEELLGLRNGLRAYVDDHSTMGIPLLYPWANRLGRLELALLRGYPFAQLYAPPGRELIAFEPMTAPTNALVQEGAELKVIDAGESYEAAFAITVA